MAFNAKGVSTKSIPSNSLMSAFTSGVTSSGAPSYSSLSTILSLSTFVNLGSAFAFGVRKTALGPFRCTSLYTSLISLQKSIIVEIHSYL